MMISNLFKQPFASLTAPSHWW